MKIKSRRRFLKVKLRQPKEKEPVSETVENVAAESTTPEEPVVEATEEEEVAPATNESSDAAETEAQEKSGESEEEEEGDLDELLAEEIEDSGAHDDYNWEVGNKSSAAYSESEIEEYLQQYESTLTAVKENEIVSGIVRLIHE